MVKAIIFLYEPDLSSLPHCQTRGLEPPPGSLRNIFGISCEMWDPRCEIHSGLSHSDVSLTLERVKPIWLIHLTIFIFIAQSDKLIWDLTNGGAVSPTSWHLLTNQRREAPNQTKFAKLIRTLAKNKSHRPKQLAVSLHHFIKTPWLGPVWVWSLFHWLNWSWESARDHENFICQHSKTI